MTLEKLWNKLQDETRYLPFRYMLFPLSLFFKWGIFLRNWGFKKGILKQKSLPAVVVSIGNIALGGTGKTPTVHLLASNLKTSSLAILSHGYKAKALKQHPALRVRELPVHSSCSYFGDEAWLLYKKNREIPIWIGKNRFLSGTKAIEEGAEILLLDDGMQHRKLKKDFEIVVLNGEDPLEKKALFPFGRLRDVPQSLKRADLILLQGVSSKKAFEQSKKLIAPYSAAPCVATKLDLSLPPPQKEVAVFCSIARPQRFLKMLEKKGVRIRQQMLLKDHASITEKRWVAFLEQAKRQGIKAIFCTEKDYVKIETYPAAIPVYPIPLEVTIIYNKEGWEELIEKIRLKTVKSTPVIEQGTFHV